MGKITGSNFNRFKSAKYIYSKVKRQFKSFGSVNLLDENDLAEYAAEVLNLLGISVFIESEAVLKIEGKKAKLPKNFKYLHAAFLCTDTSTSVSINHLQSKKVLYEDYDYFMGVEKDGCGITTDCTEDIFKKITVRQYVTEDGITEYNFYKPVLLNLSPNCKRYCSKDCVSPLYSSYNEITIDGDYIYTNFEEGYIYLQYYAFPQDSSTGELFVVDEKRVELAIEWWIKYQLLLNFWITNEVTDIQNKWGKAEQEYDKWMGEAKYINKLPSFATMLNAIRNQRGINKVSFFSQQDNTI